MHGLLVSIGGLCGWGNLAAKWVQKAVLSVGLHSCAYGGVIPGVLLPLMGVIASFIGAHFSIYRGEQKTLKLPQFVCWPWNNRDRPRFFLHVFYDRLFARKNFRSYCWWFIIPAKTWLGCRKPCINNGINCQPQLVSRILSINGIGPPDLANVLDPQNDLRNSRRHRLSVCLLKGMELD